MIHTNRTVTVGEQESKIDRPIVLYRGDREVEIEFTLVGNRFTFSEKGNVIKSVNASHGQLVLNTPSGENMFSELAECHEGKVVFVVTKEMIDEFIEIGFYSFQIRLYDSAEMKSRVTIPPVMNGFDIRNPIAAEDETNVVDQAIVDYARIFKDQSNEELPTFTWDGEYVKTEWAHHDVITENKMNKIEDALYSINANVKESDVVMLNTLDNVKKDADKYVKEHMAEVEADVEEFERKLNTDVQQFKIDTNAAITAHKNEVGEELESVNSQLAYIKSNNYYPESFEAMGDGVTDDTQAFKNMLSQIKDNSVIILSKKYLITDTLDIKNSHIKIIGNNPYKCGFIQKGNNKETIKIFKYGFECYSVGFWGDNEDFKGSTTALNYCLEELNGNDTIVKDCLFYSVFKGIELRGRNLNISNCSFQLVNECINISKHDNPDTMGDALRGIIIKDNTFHSVGSNSTDSEGIETYCVKVNDTTGLQDIIIKNNKLEAWTSTFFKGYINGVHIIGNEGIQVAGGHKYINIKYDETNYKGFSISNNIFITNADEGNINTSNHNFIYSSSSLNNGVIANNKTNRSMKEAIKIDGNIEECIIENNDFIANQYADENYNIIHIDGEIKKSMIVNNKLKSNKSSSKYGLYYKNECSDNHKSLIENNTSILCDFSDIQTNKKVVLATSKTITKNTNTELLAINYKLLSKKTLNIESYLNIVNNETSTTSVVLWLKDSNDNVINAESFLIDSGYNRLIKIKSFLEFTSIENNIKLFIRSGGSVTVNTSFTTGGITLSQSFIRAYEDNTNIKI